MRPLQLFSCLYIGFLFSACTGPSAEVEKSSYPDMVGDIAFDPALDRADFDLCHERILQYYNFSDGVQYEGERPAILAHFESQYQRVESWDGYVSIRFVVNCLGETDRFRLRAMDHDYEAQVGNSRVNADLLAAVRSMEGWSPKSYNDMPMPYYQYLSFRIVDGEITEILP